MNKYTRFRAYQLGTKGSSFSYSVDSNFTLIEARYNDVNRPNIFAELQKIGIDYITCLHITSWDDDHCSDIELAKILKELKPLRIEYPGYNPDTDCGKSSKKMIHNYCTRDLKLHQAISSEYVGALPPGKERQYNNIVYNPIADHAKHNDNSVVQLFRFGRFTVLSLGDCESSAIADRIQSCVMASCETDVMILAHHGANNGFTTDGFIKAIKPKVSICSSNYDNMYEHPHKEVRQVLYDNGIPLYTTKTGDVVVYCGEDNIVHVINLKTNSTEVSSAHTFTPKCTVPSN